MKLSKTILITFLPVMLSVICITGNAKAAAPIPLSHAQLDQIYGGLTWHQCHTCEWSATQNCPASENASANCVFYVDEETGDSGCSPASEGTYCGRTSCKIDYKDCEGDIGPEWWCARNANAPCHDPAAPNKYRKSYCYTQPEFGPDGSCHCVEEPVDINCGGTTPWCY